MDKLGNGPNERRRVGIAAQDVIYQDVDFEVSLRGLRWMPDGTEGVRAAFAKSGPVERIVRNADIVDYGEGGDVLEGIGRRDATSRAANY